MKRLTSKVGDWLKSAMAVVFLFGTMFAGGSGLIDILLGQFPTVGQNVAERLVCPAGSSIQVDQKAFNESSSDAAPRLLVLLLSSCVNGQGNVVRRGTDFSNPGLPYMGALGAYCLTTLAAEGMLIVLPIWLLYRKKAGT